MNDFDAAIAEGQDALDEISGEVFQIGGKPVTGNFSGAEYSTTLTTTGGKQENLHGTLEISRVRYPDLGVREAALITGPGGIQYRIGKIHTDPTSWLLTLTHPNARRS